MSCAWWTDQGRLCFNEAPDKPNFPWPDDPRISLCGPHRAKATKWFVPSSPPTLEYEDSFVYFVWNRSADQIKIGRSTNPTVRIRQLETQSGLEFETLLVLPETSELFERRHLQPDDALADRVVHVHELPRARRVRLRQQKQQQQ